MGSCVHTAAHRMTFCFVYAGKFMFNRPALCKGAHMNYLRKKICCILAAAVFLLSGMVIFGGTRKKGKYSKKRRKG